jgi:S-adenosyl methyltransferase
VTGDRPDWAPPGLDTTRANPARVYDYWLGGTHNFLADRDVGRSVAAVQPMIREIARANRQFLGRAVRFLAGLGIRQFLDVGSGIPTEGNVHEITERVAPGARVVYADIDPIALAHSRAILAGVRNATIIEADLREPEKLLAEGTVTGMIDLAQPVGLLLVSVLHFISDAEKPGRLVATLRDALAPGSYLVVCHGTNEGTRPPGQAAERAYNRGSSTDVHVRSGAEILRFFGGFEIVTPGLVYMPQWQPDDPADVPADPTKFWALAGVGRKP